MKHSSALVVILWSTTERPARLQTEQLGEGVSVGDGHGELVTETSANFSCKI